MRDSDRILGILQAVHRAEMGRTRERTPAADPLQLDQVDRGEMLSVKDVEEILAILLGVIPKARWY